MDNQISRDQPDSWLFSKKKREALLVRMYISMEARGPFEPKYMNNYE